MRSGRFPHPFRPTGAAWLVTSALSLVGCTTDVGASAVSASGSALSVEADAESAAAATAVVTIERSTGVASGAGNAPAGDAGEVVRAEAVARFVRVRAGAVDDAALRMVGASLDVPSPGACAVFGAARDTAGSPRSAVSLLDLGAVSLEAAGARTPLHPRELPDVADLVSGVVYAARPGEASLPARAAYVLRAAGAAEGGEAAGFTLRATAPADPADVKVSGQDMRAGALSVAAGSPVELTWEAGADDDLVYVDVASSEGAFTLRCAFTDGGRGALPASGWPADDGTLTLHRLHREAFHARGVEPGEVRFDFARVAPFQRR